MERVDSLLVNSDVLQDQPAWTVGTLQLAGLWERLEDHGRAWRTLERWTLTTGPQFTAEFLRLRMRTARTLGRRDDEIEALRAFTALRANAEASRREELEAARARLQQLTDEER